MPLLPFWACSGVNFTVIGFHSTEDSYFLGAYDTVQSGGCVRNIFEEHTASETAADSANCRWGRNSTSA